MDRTLYLNENKGLRVFRDGPSIWIREDGKAGRRVPARLVGRVVIMGNIKLESGVITLFTDRDVPVTFINCRGDSVAVALPYNEKLPRYYEEQKVFLETEENADRFKSWLHAKNKEMQLHVIQRLSKKLALKFAGDGFRERDYRKIIQQFRTCSEDQWQVILGIAASLFREMTVGCLIKAGLDPHVGVLHRRYNFSLAFDLCHILEPETEIQCLQFASGAKENKHMMKDYGNWLVTKDGMKDIIQRFENRRKQVQDIVERLIDDIFVMIRELRK
jgi:CRISPR/Cas system-associated endonuclease Cas1